MMGTLPLPYLYNWHPRRFGHLAGFNRKGETCRILARGTMNSALVEFEDGCKAVVSRNALRRQPHILEAFTARRSG